MATTKEEQDLQTISTLLKNLNAKLNAVNTSVGDIKTSIENKGVVVPDGTKLADYDDKIAAIEQTTTEADYTEIIAALESIGETLDTINGEVIVDTTVDESDPGTGGSDEPSV